MLFRTLHVPIARLSAGNDWGANGSDALNRHDDLVAVAQKDRWLAAGPDSPWGSCRDDVARSKSDRVSDVGNDLPNPVDQVAGVTVLHQLAVHVRRHL